MKFTRDQAWRYLARSKQDGEIDIDQKFKVISILRKHFGLHGLTGEYVIIDKTSCRLPDILIRGNPVIVLELDGSIHQWSEEVAKLERDESRDTDYHTAGVKLVILNQEATQNYQEDKIIAELEKQGLNRIG